ncbi:hypothetical protein HHI36_003401 [Cryptolaemus montrouzieri]|uniref:Uncharacterized protein n=1 Tax=Cryptolaemus montrouzieri TaxID=559131 RepID=A0ABD2PE11_9CUCU
MKKLIVLTAASYGKVNDTGLQEASMPGSPPVPVRGVNVMLGGVMLSAIIMVIFVLCYCCHKSNRKSPTSSPPSMYWRDPGLSMEIYTVDTQSCIEYEEYSSDSRRTSTTGPPPPYELVAESSKLEEQSPSQIPENLEPPTYEKACELYRDLHITPEGYV